jgi:hypothetical protein
LLNDIVQFLTVKPEYSRTYLCHFNGHLVSTGTWGQPIHPPFDPGTLATLYDYSFKL